MLLLALSVGIGIGTTTMNTVPAPLPASATTRIALITGAAQGIDHAIALRLASDGLDIALNDIPSKLDALNKVVKEVEALGRRAIEIPGDVTLEADVERAVEETVRQLGSLDVVCPILLCFENCTWIKP